MLKNDKKGDYATLLTASNTYDCHTFSHKSFDLSITGEENGRFIKAEPHIGCCYKNIKVNTKFDPKKNAIILFMGEIYNKILIDVDNKEDTLIKFDNLCKEHDYRPNTFTETTINKGYHYYYTLTDTQKTTLRELKLKSKDNQLFGLHIDIKYTNAISFGASVVYYQGQKLQTTITNASKLETLPEFIFDEIVKICTKEKPQKESPKKDKKHSPNKDQTPNKDENELEQMQKQYGYKTFKHNYHAIKYGLFKLPEDYYTDRILWRNIGWALASIGHEAYKKLFQEFSYRVYEKNPEIYGGYDETYNEYDHKNKDGITLGTLYYYFKKENIDINDYELPEGITSGFNFFGQMHNLYIINESKLKDKLKEYIKFIPSLGIYIIKKDDEEESILKSTVFESGMGKFKYIIKVYDKNEEEHMKSKPIITLMNEFISDYSYQYTFNPDPNFKEDGYYNAFKGFKSKLINEIITKKLENKLKLLLDHIKNVWANKNEDVYKYILLWLATIIQKPHVKTGKAIVIISTEGAGKDIIFNFIKDTILGNYAVRVIDMEKVTGRFNSTIKNKILVLFDEANQVDGNYHKSHDILKSLITDKRQTIEYKGVDAIEMDDYCNYLIFSNNDNPVRISGNDRRFVITEASNEYVKNIKYFERLGTYLNQDIGNHFYTYLMNYDLNSSSLFEIPKTELRSNNIKKNLPNGEKFVLDKANYLIDKYKDGISNDQLYTEYQDYCKNYGININSPGNKREIILNQIGKINKSVQIRFGSDSKFYGHRFNIIDLENYFTNKGIVFIKDN